MGQGEGVTLTKIQRNNRIFAISWLVLEILFCVLYAIYCHTGSNDIYSTDGLYPYVSAVGIGIATIIGLGGIMTYVTGLKWSGFGFALLITALCYQYYFMINAFWTKADIQYTIRDPFRIYQYYGDDFFIWVSDAIANNIKTFGNTATGAFKMALTICVAFSAVIGRAGPLQILIFVLIGGALYELNRQIIVTEMYDIGGSNTIFMFGGIMGTIVSILLAVVKQKDDLVKRENYSSSRFNASIAVICSAFFWVFYPTIFADVPLLVPQSTASTRPFLVLNGAISAYWCISTCVVTSLALSAVLHGRIRIKDLLYGTFAGAAIIGTSAPHIFNPIAAILLGMIAGLLQPFFNMLEQKLAQNKIFFCTNAPFVFAVQGFLGSLAAGIIRAIRDNNQWFDYDGNYRFPFVWDVAGQFYRACFISFGIAIGAGFVVGLFVLLVSGQQTQDYFQDRAYWIIEDDGLRYQKGEVKEQNEIKGVHSYLGGN